MLTMYVDESYSHPPKPLIYTVAGYISADWRWRKFEIEWSRALSAEVASVHIFARLRSKDGQTFEWLCAIRTQRMRRSGERLKIWFVPMN